jgi:hypothetical protein
LIFFVSVFDLIYNIVLCVHYCISMYAVLPLCKLVDTIVVLLIMTVSVPKLVTLLIQCRPLGAVPAHSMFVGAFQLTAHAVSCSLFPHSADVCCGQSLSVRLNNRIVCVNCRGQLISHSSASYCADSILPDTTDSRELQAVPAV